jgi:hypothetical protein
MTYLLITMESKQMVATVDTAFINQFADNLHSLVEQRGSKLRASVKVEMAKGEKHFFDRLGSFEASEITSRLQTTDLIDPAHSRRMASVARYDASTYLDDIDKLKMLIDPTNDYAIKLARAHGRKLDDIILDAMLGSAATGQTGSGSQAFDTANQQIAHGSAGFTVAKFNQALRILESNDVDIDDVRLYLAIGARAVEDLLGDSSNQMTSFDFQGEKALASGGLPSFRGVNIIRTQRIPDETADTTYRGLLYTEDNVKVAMAQDIEVKTAERADVNFLQQVSTYMMYGAVRMEEETVVDVLYQ